MSVINNQSITSSSNAENPKSIYCMNEHNVIISFNYEGLKFIPKELYDDITCGNALFCKGQKWMDRELLFTAASYYSSKLGFEVIKNRVNIQCSRFGNQRRKTTKSVDSHGRPFQGGPLKVDCTWFIQIASCKQTNVNKRTRDNFSDGSNVVIKKVCCNHRLPCQPSAQNLTAVRLRGGKYVKNIPNTAWFQLCNTMKQNNMRLITSQIKGVLSPILPKSLNITKQDVFNAHIRVKRLMKLFENNSEYKQFEQFSNNATIAAGLDEDKITDDEALAIANDVFVEFINKDMSIDGSMVSFVEYLQMISVRAKGFVYDVAKDSYGDINGAVW